MTAYLWASAALFGLLSVLNGIWASQSLMVDTAVDGNIWHSFAFKAVLHAVMAVWAGVLLA